RSVTDSAKRAKLHALLAELVAEGRRVLVFSQFVEMLLLIEADLAKAGIASLSLTGQTRDRAAVLDALPGRSGTFHPWIRRRSSIVSRQGSEMSRSCPIPETVTLHVPFRLVKRGGRKEMQLPEGAPQTRRTDNTLVKALARAFRWKRMLEAGEFASISELAASEGLAFTYMARLLRLTVPGSDFVGQIIGWPAPPTIPPPHLAGPF